MTTSTDVAMSTRDCWLQPGQGLIAGIAAACPVATYNAGFNTRACTRCPGALTTVGTGSINKAQCVAPAGELSVKLPCAWGLFWGDGNRAVSRALGERAEAN